MVSRVALFNLAVRFTRYQATALVALIPRNVPHAAGMRGSFARKMIPGIMPLAERMRPTVCTPALTSKIFKSFFRRRRRVFVHHHTVRIPSQTESGRHSVSATPMRSVTKKASKQIAQAPTDQRYSCRTRSGTERRSSIINGESNFSKKVRLEWVCERTNLQETHRRKEQR